MSLHVRVEAEALCVEVDAPFYDDPPPPGPAGPTDRLWEYEVVELFLLGASKKYLELEFGPHGHHLALLLAGRRQVVRSKIPIEYAAAPANGRWRGSAQVHRKWLPQGLERFNAYAIHGTGATRRYLAHFPVPGRAPDFHCLDQFGELPRETWS